MGSMKLFLTGAALGAGAAYWFDPQRGSRRRALARDQAIRIAGEVVGQADAGARDFSHRVHGIASHARWLLRKEEHASDDVIRARVRATLGHVTHHPHGIEVRVEDGRVELSGAVPVHDRIPLLRHVAQVPGVRSVHDDLTPRPTNGDAEQHAKPWLSRQLSRPAGRFILGGAGLVILGAVSPYVLFPLSLAMGASLAARREEQVRGRRNNGRNPIRWATSQNHMRPRVSTTPDEIDQGVSPTGQAKPVPPSPQ